MTKFVSKHPRNDKIVYLNKRQQNMHRTLLFGFLFFNISLSAQQNVDVSSGNVNALSTSFFKVVGGEPFVSARFTKLVDGTPYFKNDWLKGKIILDGGQEFKGMEIKLDLYDSKVHYKDEKGQELIATSTIKKVVLFDTAARQVFNFVNGSFIETSDKISGWYQLLAEGKVSLLKKFEKKLEETKPYGSATVEQSIVSSPRYFIVINKTLAEIKKLKDLPDILPDKKEEIAAYIKTKKLSKRNDESVESVINYYNGL